MKALRIQVERVVRPIRASYLRKDRMREELLTHLTRLFEEELLRTGDAQSATAEATHRFGDAPTLARELQASVPWLERWAFVNLPAYGPFRRRQRESPVRYRNRVNRGALAIGTVAYSVFALVLAAIASRRPHRADQITGSQVLIILAGYVGIFFATMIGCGLLNEGIRQELERHAAATTARKRQVAIWRIVGYAAAGSGLLGAAAAVLMLLVEAFIPVSIITRAGFWWVTLGAIALGPPLTLLLGWSRKDSIRRLENWDSLDLDEQRAA